MTRFKVGDRVWGVTPSNSGTTCELATIGEEWLDLSPIGVSDADLAAVALTG